MIKRISSSCVLVFARACVCACALSASLQSLVMERTEEGRLEVDVLITAVEASLWIGEQFASDLQALFPSLRVVPVSANKVRTCKLWPDTFHASTRICASVCEVILRMSARASASVCKIFLAVFHRSRWLYPIVQTLLT